jgi:hypothetical protein
MTAMSESPRIQETFDEQRDGNLRVEEGGWQKAVAPPAAESRPAGLPPAVQPHAASGGAESKERGDA